MKSVCVCAVIALTCGVASAQPCLPDADGDGHPIFGNPQVLPWFWADQGEEPPTLVTKTTDIVFDDFNGDGNLDVGAACNSATHDPLKYIDTEYASVMFGHGDGTFSPPSFYDAGKEPCSVAAGDFNGDGRPDLALANAHANQPGTVSVLLNKGDGTFWPDVEYPVGTQPRCVRSGDLNGDGRDDLVILNVITDDVSLFLANEDGSLPLEQRLAVGSVTPRGYGNLTFPYPGPFMALADVDGDRDLDLALPCGSKVKFLINDGKGVLTLSASTPAFSGGSVYDIVSADLSGEGIADLAVALYSGNTTPRTAVAPGLGNMQFAPPVNYDVGTKPSNFFHYVIGISAGDVDGDGDLDLGVAHEWFTHAVLLRNKGDGTFAPKELVETAAGPWVVRWRDINTDGKSDLAVVTNAFGSNLGRIGVLLSEAGNPLSFEPNKDDKAEFPWISPFTATCADLDTDGDQDVAVASYAHQDPGAIIVILNDSSGSLDAGTGYAMGPPPDSSATIVEAADLTGDGVPDLVAGTVGEGLSLGPGRVRLLTNAGDGSFTVQPFLELPGYLPLAVAIGDMDGDTDNDVVVAAVEHSPLDNFTPKDRKVIVLANDGHGNLSVGSELKYATMTWSPQSDIKLGDFDDDGDLDVVATSGSKQTSGRMVALTNDGSGALSIDQAWDTSHLPWSVFVGDLDGDNDPDIALGNRVQAVPDPYLVIYKNDGRGKFLEGQTLSDKDLRCRRMIGADFDGDGDTDLAWTIDYSSVMVHLNNGDGTFAPKFYYGVGMDPGGLAAADLDGDGRTDLVVCHSASDHNISVLRNRLCKSACYADCDGTGELDIDDFICLQTEFAVGDAKADCDGSGELDIDDFICFQTAFGLGCP